MAAKKKTKSTAPKEDPSFEERLASLEAVVDDLEGDDLSLEDSLERYKKGMEHLKACRALLDRAEAKLVELVDDGSERSLRVGADGLEPEPGGGVA